MIGIFEYIDRLMAICRPRKLLYMAIDGVVSVLLWDHDVLFVPRTGSQGQNESTEIPSFSLRERRSVSQKIDDYVSFLLIYFYSEDRAAIARIKRELREKGAYVPPDEPKGERFDSNCITPVCSPLKHGHADFFVLQGTPFMFKLAKCLRYYIHDRLNNDAGWQGIKVKQRCFV